MQYSCSICDCETGGDVYVDLDGDGECTPVCETCRRMLRSLFRGDTYRAAMRHLDLKWEYSPGECLRDEDDRYWLVDSRLFDADVDVEPLEERLMEQRKYRLKRPVDAMEVEEKVVDEEWLLYMSASEVSREEAESVWRERAGVEYSPSD